MLLSGALAGCAGDIEGEGPGVGVANAALTWSDGSRTVTVDAEVEDPLCNGLQGQIGVTGSFTASAALTIAMVVSIDGGVAQVITVATPANFTPVGRDFAASFGTDANVPNGARRQHVLRDRQRRRQPQLSTACLQPVNTNPIARKSLLLRWT